MSRGARIVLVVAGQVLLLGLIGTTFWYQDWRYSLPTPPPERLDQPALGSSIALPPALQTAHPNNEPLFLHFFNPACPCSRFNLDHVRGLAGTFGRRVRFVMVLEGADEAELWKEFHALRFPIEAITDPEGEVANRVGVYSTPQAVLLDARRRLFFRGNYNRSRYCTDAETEFARLALEALEAGNVLPSFPAAATTAFGCELPSNRGTSP